MSGSLLMTKAENFARRFSDEEFVCSAGCVDRFNLRHISFGNVSGEATGDMTTEWFNAVCRSVGETYAVLVLTLIRLGFCLD